MTSQLSDEMKTFLTSVNDASASGPSSRPRPDCFMPPNGVEYRTDAFEFTDRLPASTARATRKARPRFSVQMEPDSPYSVSLASRIASSSSSNGTTATTGRKISSRQAAEAGSTGASTVGGNQNPGPSGALPRNATGASSGTYEATVDRWDAEINGPISVAACPGSPTTTPLTAGSSNSMNRSYPLRSTRIRERAQQS